MKSIDIISQNVTTEEFRFGIIADPQVLPRNTEGNLPHPSQPALEQACKELMQLEKPLDFLILLGDLVNTADDPSYENFVQCMQEITCPIVIVHGNHDSRAPFTPHKKMLRRYMDSEDMYYSFHAGNWHFVVLPCYEGVYNEFCDEITDYLQQDLEAHRDWNTVVLIHMHGLPQGNSQSEWYCYVLELRRKVAAIIEQYDNVKFYINGHAHPGLKAAYKNMRRHNGIVYLTAPCVTQPRPFGEEFPGGIPEDGGYYLVADANRQDITFCGYQAGKPLEICFPQGDQIPEYTDDMEPRWKHLLMEIPPNPVFLNGDFSHGMQGWHKKFRYQPDCNPLAVQELVPDPVYTGTPEYSAHLCSKSFLPNSWSNDEHCEIYQIFMMPERTRPVLHAEYFVKKAPENGGGFIRFLAMRDREFCFMLLFHWGKEEHRVNILPQGFGYELTGVRQGASFLNELGKQKKGMYFQIETREDQWNTLDVDLWNLYDQAMGTAGACRQLGINKLMVGLGTWANQGNLEISKEQNQSEAWFRRISCREQELSGSIRYNNGAEISMEESMFEIPFGKG